jgi:hypothetical protein
MDQRVARDEAIKRVEEHSVVWRSFARLALRDAAVFDEYLTSDDVWHVLKMHKIPEPIEPRAMGPVMLAGVRERWIVATDKVQISLDPASPNHNRPQRVYRSLVVGGRGATWDQPEARPFPLQRIGSKVDVKMTRCDDCGEMYAVRTEHQRTFKHREAVAKAQTIESIMPMPVQPEIQRFEELPRKVDFGSVIPCPRCKGFRRKRKGVLDDYSADPYDTKVVCPRCNGMGIVPNVGPNP